LNNRTLFVSIVGLCAAFFFFSSCGKKSPPFIPKEKFFLRVADLQGKWIGGSFHLRGRIEGPGAREGAGDSIQGGRVYFAVYPQDNLPCKDCPIAFQEYRTFGKEAIKGQTFYFRFPAPIEKRVYFFKVYLIGPEGVIGPPSNRIEIPETGSG